MSRIGLLGGTFNPIHLGHLAMAEAVKDRMGLSKVIFIPSNIPPHKSSKNLAPAKDRYNMVKLATKGNAGFFVSNIEIKRKGPSYTIDTLAHLKRVYPKRTKFFFIIGQDTVPELKTWKNIAELFKMVSFVAVNRPNYVLKGRQPKHYKVVMPELDIASSFLRKQIAGGKSIKYLVPDSVFGYIKRHKLYRK